MVKILSDTFIKLKGFEKFSNQKILTLRLKRAPCVDIILLDRSADDRDIRPLAAQGIPFHTRSQNLALSGWLRLKIENYSA